MEAEPAEVGAPEASSQLAAAVPPAVPAPLTTYRKDYAPSLYLIDNVVLHFNLHEESCTTHATISFKPNHESAVPPALVLDGRKDIKLVSIKVAGRTLGEDDYVLTERTLTIKSPPAGPFEVETVVETKPQENTMLEGLYKSSGMYCTQCEAQGFRGITYFLDRPDVMAKYVTRIEADKALYPVLLGNGNLIDSGDLDGNRHFAVWEDPWVKACYLFALVAGDLAMRDRNFTTCNGRDVVLRIFAQEKNISQVDHALESLVKAMRWDEESFGREYDLSLFNIVAVDDFTMGAMENKSLNLFNSKLVLASPTTATDAEYARIEAIVAHEYFHNWTGNRVTCRDWFQLTLKEGLTVFRDQEFSSDMHSRPVKRIEDVMFVRVNQFPEDSGPMAHPIRPDSYEKMDNFYTPTVYRKGAQIVRLYQTLLGKDGFRKGMDLYFERHDGQAVSCDDFRAAMADATKTDLSKFDRWYSQAGTPVLKVSTAYDSAARTFTLTASQHTPPSAGQPSKLPVPIPIAVGLLGPDGRDMPMTLASTASSSTGTTAILLLEEATKTFVFLSVDSPPVPSVLRGFSAPVKLTVEGQTDEELLFLFAHDSDEFNRWEAGQRLAMKLLLALYAAAQTGTGSLADRLVAAGGVPDSLTNAYKAVLTDPELDGKFRAMAVTMPSSAEIASALDGGADPVCISQVLDFVRQQLAMRLRPELEALVKANDVVADAPYVFNAQHAARRAIKNKALFLLSTLGDADITAAALQRFRDATNMTDQSAALSDLVDLRCPERELALSEFYEAVKGDPLVVLKWVLLQAESNLPGNLALVRSVMEHPAFTISNPNNCYALFLGFARSPVNFHAANGSGYEFMADSVIKVDALNPQVASRLARTLSQFRQFDEGRQSLMKAQLERLAVSGLSANTYEIVSKSLA